MTSQKNDRHSSRTLYLRLLGYVRPYWKVFVLALAVMAASAATEPLFPALMKPMLDKGFGASSQKYLITIPLAIVGIFVLRGVLGYLSSYAMSWLSNRVITDLRSHMFTHLVRLPSSYYLSHPSSEPMTRISNDINGVASAATSVITVLVCDTLIVVGLLGWLLYLNWQLTLISLVMIPVVAVAIRTFSLRLRSLSRAGQQGNAELLHILQESIHNQKVVKIFGGEAQELGRFERANNALRGYGMRQAIAAAATVPIVQLAASVALATVVYIAMLQSNQNGTTVGSFVSFITAMLMLLAPMKRLADVNAPLQRGLAAAESIFTLLDEAPETDSGRIALPRARGEVVFDRVGFVYPHAERPALKDVSLHIAAGETVALVGASGSGKTTLANLLPRFLHPGSGRILVDGHRIEDIRLDSLRTNMAVVTQDVLLFDDTVAGNIAYGSGRQNDMEAIEAAAVAAFAHDFIQAMPEGYATRIGEHGARLSGGQRQRIAIARALFKNAPILILDEATSALDNESERQVQAALERLMQNRTTLVIAHRLSTIEKADRIVVMQHGSIVEAGPHQALLETNGVYANLYRLQSAGIEA